MARMKRYRYVGGGVVVETDVIVCRRDEWESLPQSRDSAWLAAPVGRNLTLAVRAPLGFSVENALAGDVTGGGRLKRFRHIADEAAIETQAMICNREDWSLFRQSDDDAWFASPIGRNLLLAVRAPDCIPSPVGSDR